MAKYGLDVWYTGETPEVEYAHPISDETTLPNYPPA
jgi:hypothetical protein